jgi:hypothetical protein
MKILFLVSPVLGAYGGYYFSLGEKKKRTGTISEDRWKIAFWSTVTYHALLLCYLFFVIYIHDYRGSEGGVGFEDSSFEELIANGLQLGVFLSAAATGPVAYLIGSTRIEVPQASSAESAEENNE